MVYKLVFIHDNGARHDICEEVVITPHKLSEKEILDLLYKKKPYNSNESVITNLKAYPAEVVDRPYII